MDINITQLAAIAAVVLDEIPSEIYDTHGMEVAPGFFNVYNTAAGQSRAVIYHPESDLVFKQPEYWGGRAEESNSGKVLGEVELYGSRYTIRYPRWYVFEGLEAQEYVHGEPDPCIAEAETWQSAWCEHAYAVAEASGLSDTHTGNWKIVGNEIVVFDF